MAFGSLASSGGGADFRIRFPAPKLRWRCTAARSLIRVDEDQSAVSHQFVSGLEREGSFVLVTRPSSAGKGDASAKRHRCERLNRANIAPVSDYCLVDSSTRLLRMVSGVVALSQVAIGRTILPSLSAGTLVAAERKSRRHKAISPGYDRDGARQPLARQRGLAAPNPQKRVIVEHRGGSRGIGAGEAGGEMWGGTLHLRGFFAENRSGIYPVACASPRPARR